MTFDFVAKDFKIFLRGNDRGFEVGNGCLLATPRWTKPCGTDGVDNSGETFFDGDGGGGGGGGAALMFF